MVELLGVSWRMAGSVVISTLAMYLLFILLIRALGQRSLLGTSSLDLACVAAFGAVIGRTMLLAQPTLLGGVIALTTLFLVQTAFRTVAGGAIGRSLNRKPTVLMRGPEPDAEVLRHARFSEDDLRQALRLAGVTQRSQINCVVLERNGAISVLRGDEVDPWLVADLTPARSDVR